MDTIEIAGGLLHPVCIGSVSLGNNLFLAPMAGYTDRSFRTICRHYGAAFTYTEMVSAEGIARSSLATEQLIKRGENEDLLCIQVFLPDATVARRCIPRLLSFRPTVIDINCGCPVPKVVKTGSGAALLRSPEKIHDIVRVFKQECDRPVSVKIRLGWDALSINYLESADAALAAGADMISLHARTKAMGYTGVADWHALGDLKRFVLRRYPSVPVFGSGDLFSPSDAQAMLMQSGVDGVLFARGAIGNPFIFCETIKLLTGHNRPQRPSLSERIEVMRWHLYLLGNDVGEGTACRQMRKHVSAYLKGIPHASRTKNDLMHAQTYDEYESAFIELAKTCSYSL